ncbi:MAG TPA: DUF2191 domain-containing protein [Thermoanaerobaculia bacterium]|jgi:hypothetical protein|nr:DUF2191 domain-containing protein [Thermoanaerobaculia bacterium]
MRTTLTLDDALARELKKLAVETGKPFKVVVNETLMRGLQAPVRRSRFRQKTFSLGGARPGVDLTKALALADALEDAERAAKLSRGR